CPRYSGTTKRSSCRSANQSSSPSKIRLEALDSRPPACRTAGRARHSASRSTTYLHRVFAEFAVSFTSPRPGRSISDLPGRTHCASKLARTHATPRSKGPKLRLPSRHAPDIMQLAHYVGSPAQTFRTHVGTPRRRRTRGAVPSRRSDRSTNEAMVL